MEIGRKIIQLNTVDSTNNYVANLIKQRQIDSGTVVLADEQTAGRGQRSVNWESQPGMNLTFSYFLDNVNLSVEQQFRISQIVALSIIHLLEGYSINAKIKWPNDIYVGNEKIAGILIENQLKNTDIKSAIVGIGLNVNQTDWTSLSATSIAKITEKRKPLMDVLLSYIGKFNNDWKSYLNDYELLQRMYLSHLLHFEGSAMYKDESGEFEGTIINVLPSGRLVVRKGNDTCDYGLKEISLIS